jgi:hypothetical protein
MQRGMELAAMAGIGRPVTSATGTRRFTLNVVVDWATAVGLLFGHWALGLRDTQHVKPVPALAISAEEKAYGYVRVRSSGR